MQVPLERLEALALELLLGVRRVSVCQLNAVAVQLMARLYTLQQQERRRHRAGTGGAAIRCTLRDLYYCEKHAHAVGDAEPEAAPLTAASVHRAVQRLCVMLGAGVQRHHLGIVAAPKGVAWAPHGYVMRWRSLSGQRCEAALDTAPRIPGELAAPDAAFRLCRHRAESATPVERRCPAVVLAIEKETVLRRLVCPTSAAARRFTAFAARHEVMLLSGRGYPDQATLAVAQQLQQRDRVRLLTLTDCDPDGVAISRQYGPTATRLGVCPEDVRGYRGQARKPLTARDRALATRLRSQLTLAGRASLVETVRGMLSSDEKVETEFLSDDEALVAYVMERLRAVVGRGYAPST